MRLARCEKGHYYDKDKFSACPHCNGMQVAPGETVAFEDPDAKKEEAPAEPAAPAAPKVQVEDRVPFSKNPYSTEELAKNDQAKLFTEEVEPMADTGEEKPETVGKEPRLFTEEMNPLENGAAEEEQPLDEMKTILLEEEQPTATSEPEELTEEPEEETEPEKKEEIEAEAVETETVETETTEPEVAEKPEETLVETEIAEETSEPEEVPSVEETVKAEEKAIEEEVATETIEEKEAVEEEEAATETEEEEEVAEREVAEETVAAAQEETSGESLQKNIANAVSSRIPDDTIIEELNSNPVVGWLIGIEGMHRGRSYDIKEGRNFIGRSTAMDICLSGNNKINRERHAIITYDPRSKTFFFQPDESRDLIYINDKLLLGPEPMKQEDVIFMGEEQFLFIPLQSDKIDWVN